MYNEAERLKENLDLLFHELDALSCTYEVIAVSDGSTDTTNEILSAYQHSHLRLVTLPENHGKGYAVRQGFIEAQGERVMFIDGGMELDPKQIALFLTIQQAYGADIVIGSKRHPDSVINCPWYRRSLSFILQEALQRTFKLSVKDTQVGMKLFRREVIEHVLPHLTINGYGFDLELLLGARALGFNNIIEAPIKLDYYAKQARTHIADTRHVFRVGCGVLKDVYMVYRRAGKALRPVSRKQQHAGR